jgi:hypothetical protein
MGARLGSRMGARLERRMGARLESWVGPGLARPWLGMAPSLGLGWTALRCSARILWRRMRRSTACPRSVGSALDLSESVLVTEKSAAISRPDGLLAHRAAATRRFANLNNSTIAMTFDIYGHLFPSEGNRDELTAAVRQLLA